MDTVILSPKGITVLVIVFVMLGVMIVWGLENFVPVEPLGEKAPDIKAEASEDPLKLILTIEKTRYMAAEWIYMWTEIVNISNSTVELHYQNVITYPPVRFIVYDQRDDIIYSSRANATPLGSLSFNRTLEPGNSFGRVEIWEQVSNEEKHVTPGEYRINAEIIPDALHVSKYINGKKVYLGTKYIETPPLTITVSAGFTKAEASEGSLKFALAIDKTNYEIGEKVTMSLHITNISNSTLELFYATPFVCPPLRFTVYDQKNNVVYNSGTYARLAGEFHYNQTLESNCGLGAAKTWKQIDKNGEQVASGEYRITAEIIPDALHVSKYVNGKKVYLGTKYIETPPLTITIP